MTTVTRTPEAAPPAPRRDRDDHRALTAKQKLSRFDVKASPYFYVAPFFVLFALVGLFPLVYTFVVSLNDWSLFVGHCTSHHAPRVAPLTSRLAPRASRLASILVLRVHTSRRAATTPRIAGMTSTATDAGSRDSVHWWQTCSRWFRSR